MLLAGEGGCEEKREGPAEQGLFVEAPISREDGGNFGLAGRRAEEEKKWGVVSLWSSVRPDPEIRRAWRDG